MSHKATLWAIEQRGLKPTTKIMLWHLCDRFNPDLGCFPSQARLAEDCEISRSTLNDHLDRLAVDRIPSFAPKTAARNQPMRLIRWVSLRTSGIRSGSCHGTITSLRRRNHGVQGGL